MDKRVVLLVECEGYGGGGGYLGIGEWGYQRGMRCLCML